MKRLLAALLLLCTCLSLVCCGGKNGDEGETEQETTVTTVSKEEFYSALSFEGVESVTCRSESYYEDLGDEPYKKDSYFEGKKSKIVYDEPNNDWTNYFEIDGTMGYIYYEEEPYWIRIRAELEKMLVIHSIERLSDTVNYLEFENFEYVNGIYKGKAEENGVEQDIELKFENGRLTSFVRKGVLGGYSFEHRDTFSDYGSTTVTLPEEYLESNEYN